MEEYKELLEKRIEYNQFCLEAAGDDDNLRDILLGATNESQYLLELLKKFL